MAAIGGAELLGEPDAAGAQDLHGVDGAHSAIDAEADGLGGCKGAFRGPDRRRLKGLAREFDGADRLAASVRRRSRVAIPSAFRQAQRSRPALETARPTGWSVRPSTGIPPHHPEAASAFGLASAARPASA